MDRLHEFREPVLDRRGRPYHAHVEAARRDDGMWEARVVFTPVQAGDIAATSKETVQRDVSDLQYWAGGLTPVYLEGALERAQDALRLERRGDWRMEPREARTAKFRVHSREDGVPAELLGTFALKPGLARELPDGSRIRYTGTQYGGADGSDRAHAFELEYADARTEAERWLRARVDGARGRLEFED